MSEHDLSHKWANVKAFIIWPRPTWFLSTLTSTHISVKRTHYIMNM